MTIRKKLSDGGHRGKVKAGKAGERERNGKGEEKAEKEERGRERIKSNNEEKKR